METSNSIINLDNINWDNWDQRLNTPRSLEACKRCGVNPNDLYFVNYETFINLHIDIKHMPRDFQELRYNYFEKIRRENVKLCTEERIKLINDHNFKMQEENHLSKSFNMSKSYEVSKFSQKNYSHEQRVLDQMKNKQKKEIEFLLECETKVERIRRENEEKDFHEKVRDEQIKRAIFDNHKRDEELRQKKEKYKQDLLKVEINEQQQRNLMRFLENQTSQSKVRNSDGFEEDEKLIESFRKQSASSLKHAFTLESDLHEQQKKTMERQRMMMERDKIRKANNKQKKFELKLESMKFKEYTERKIAFAKNQFDVKIMQQKNEVERKDKLNEEKRKYFNQLKSMAVKREKDFHRIKTMDMMKSLERNKILEKQRMIAFIEKHRKLEEQKRAIDMMNYQRKASMDNKINEAVSNARLKMQTELKLKALNVIKKHELIDKRAIKRREDAEREKMYKNEINFLKDEELKYNLMKQNKINQYNKEKNLDKLIVKSKKIEEFKKFKDSFEIEKIKAQNYISKKKEDDKLFYDRFTKKSSLISLEDLQEMFPGDDKIIEKFMKFKEEKGDYKATNRSFDDYKMNRSNSGISDGNASFEFVKNSSFNDSFEKAF